MGSIFSSVNLCPYHVKWFCCQYPFNKLPWLKTFEVERFILPPLWNSTLAVSSQFSKVIRGITKPNATNWVLFRDLVFIFWSWIEFVVEFSLFCSWMIKKCAPVEFHIFFLLPKPFRPCFFSRFQFLKANRKALSIGHVISKLVIF